MSAPTRWPARIRIPVLLIFVLSGAAALIEEIAWSRQLVLVFGNTTQAVSAILTGFFGGMAIGATLGGRLADRVTRPLRLYGLLELALAVVVLATPITFQFIDDVYHGIYPALEGSPTALALVRLGLALLALGPATIMMGATLPTLTRFLTRGGHLSEAFGRLYAANTIGAILGTLAAGAVLIEVLGLSGAVAAGAACSAVAGVVALLVSRLLGEGPSGLEATPVRSDLRDRSRADDRGRLRLALVVAFVSGLTSLGYQVLWTRLLSSGTGNTTYVFTVILALFLTGIAIGALIFNIVRPRLRDPRRLVGISQILIAVLVIGGVTWFTGQPQTISAAGPLGSVTALFLSAIPIVLGTTIVLGLTFPAAAALLPAGADRVGRNAGSLLGVNTFGAILGSFVVPFVLIPAIGSPRSIALLGLGNVALGVAILWRTTEPATRTRRAFAATAAVVAVALAFAVVNPSVLAQPNVGRIHSQGGVIFEAAEDEIATVEAGQISETAQLWVAGTSMTLLTVDARLMAILPLIARPNAADSLIVAFGMGSSFRSALIAGMHAEAVELVPSVPQMFGHFYDDADTVLGDPNGRVIIADGRNHLELTERSYDIIVTDPPPPLESSGASVISSYDYYVSGRARLKPGGVMMQWIPFGSTLEEFKAHLRSFVTVFPEVSVTFGPGGYGLFMLGSDAPIALSETSIREVLARPGVLDDISGAFDSPAKSVDGWVDVIEDRFWISGPDVQRFVGSGPLITDDRPIPEYFLLRRAFGEPSPGADETLLRSLAP